MGSSGLLLLSCVRRLCQARHQREEPSRLSAEEPVGGQEVQSAHCGALGLGGADDGADREFTVEERRRLGHDQVRTEVLPSEWTRVEVRKDQAVRWVLQGRGVTGLVRPGLKVHRLGWADAEQYA